MTQGLYFLQGFDPEVGPEEDGARIREVLKAYAYADVVAAWYGTHEDRPGLYFVLEGHEVAVRSTIERLASGLYFARAIVRDLEVPVDVPPVNVADLEQTWEESQG